MPMNLLHWDYFLAIDSDLETVSRYVDFTEANLGTYSTELTRLYLAICSEVDVVARQLTKKIDPEAKAWDIKDYRSVIPARYAHFCEFPVAVPRLGSSLKPWKDWTAANPQWWSSYNAVKHHRDAHYPEANLGNVLHSACGLFVLTFYFYQENFQAHDIDPGPMRALAWDRSLGSTLWFAPDYRVPDFPDMLK
jgi:hypothetical protein